MTSSAIWMMAVAMIMVWGGLALSVLHLIKHPEEPDD